MHISLCLSQSDICLYLKVLGETVLSMFFFRFLKYRNILFIHFIFLKKYFSEFLMYSGFCCCLIWLLANVSYQLYNSRIFPITPGLEVNILCCKLPCLYWGRGKSLPHNTLQPLQQNSISLWIYNLSLCFFVNAIE